MGQRYTRVYVARNIPGREVVRLTYNGVSGTHSFRGGLRVGDTVVNSEIATWMRYEINRDEQLAANPIIRNSPRGSRHARAHLEPATQVNAGFCDH